MGCERQVGEETLGEAYAGGGQGDTCLTRVYDFDQWLFSRVYKMSCGCA